MGKGLKFREEMDMETPDINIYPTQSEPDLGQMIESKSVSEGVTKLPTLSVPATQEIAAEDASSFVSEKNPRKKKKKSSKG